MLGLGDYDGGCLTDIIYIDWSDWSSEDNILLVNRLVDKIISLFRPGCNMDELFGEWYEDIEDGDMYVDMMWMSHCISG